MLDGMKQGVKNQHLLGITLQNCLTLSTITLCTVENVLNYLQEGYMFTVGFK